MATEAQLIEALRRADAAGNQDDAQYFAGQIKAMREFSAAEGKPTAPGPAPSMAEDIVRGADTGIAKGIAATAGAAGDFGNIIGAGMRAAGIQTRDTSQPLPDWVTVPTQYNPPTSGQVNADIQSVGGDYYKPRYGPGQYAETIASFAPAALLPGSLVRRSINVVAPAATSETVGRIAHDVDVQGGSNYEPYARAIGALGAAGIPAAARTGLSMANRATAAVRGRGFLNPTTEAARRLSEAFAADGGLDVALDRQGSFQRSGASAPTVLDLGGGNVRRLVRAAAGGGGPAETAALNYGDQVRSNLQDNVVSRARQLTPDYQGSAAQLGAEMEANQGRLATEQYRQPYSQPVTVTREMVSALEGPDGRRAINEAYATARARRDTQQLAELSDLRAVAEAQAGGQNMVTGRFQSLEDALNNLSAGSLDRVMIAMRERAGAMAASGRRGMASGLGERVTDIRNALDETPGLVEARDSYRQMQAGRDSLDAGATVLSSPSSDYAGQITELANRGASGRLGPPNLGPGLRVGARQAITDAVEAPTAGATGVLNRIGTSNRATANLAATFGEGAAGRFQEAVRNEVARLRNANFISPETGSQTQGRLADEALVGGIPTSLGHLVSRIADKIFRGTQLTAQEREQIVNLGLSEADVRRFATQASRVDRGPRAATVLNQSQATSGQ